MTLNRMIKLLEIEHECMLRGANNNCNRDCAHCSLVQDSEELNEMYSSVIEIMECLHKLSDALSERFAIPCDMCHKYFKSNYNCPEIVRSCNSKKHWDMLIERIMQYEAHK